MSTITLTNRLTINNPYQDTVSDYVAIWNPTTKEVGWLSKSALFSESSPEYNKITTETGFTLIDNTLNINPNWTWLIKKITYSNVSNVIFNIPFTSSAEMKRTDIIIANSDNSFTRLIGEESETNPIAPTILQPGLVATVIQVTNDSLTPEEPDFSIYASLAISSIITDDGTVSATQKHDIIEFNGMGGININAVGKVINFDASLLAPLASPNFSGIPMAPTVPTATNNGQIATTSFVHNAINVAAHNPVTLGTANGLSLSTQVLSLGLASGSVNGALSSTDWNTFNGKQNTLGFTPENIANKNVANGYAGLDAGGKIPSSQLPNSVMELQGEWNASTNTPTLINGIGNPGDIWKVTTPGTQNLGSGNITFEVNDFAIYGSNGIWFKSDNTDAVNSVFGRIGTVIAQNGDYTASQVTNVPFGNISALTVQAALNELDSEKAIDANVLHKTGDETKTGNLTVNQIIKSGAPSTNILLAGGSDITQASLAPNIDHNSLAGLQLAGAGVTYGHITDGAQTIAGVKSMINTGATQINGLNLTNNGTFGSTSLLVSNASTGSGVALTNYSSGKGIELTLTGGSSGQGIGISNAGAGEGINISNFGTGTGLYIGYSGTGSTQGLLLSNSSTNSVSKGIYSGSTSAGTSIYSSISGSGSSIVSNVGTSGTGFAYVGQNNSVNTFTVDKLGTVTGTSFIKSGATATNILLAGGTDIPQSTFALASGSGSYIQNQNASAQSANMWISGNGIFNGNVGIGTSSPSHFLTILGSDSTLPSLGSNGGKFGLLNGTGGGQYGLISGILNNGNAYQQVQRIDGTATAYNLLLQPNGGNVGIGTSSPDGLVNLYRDLSTQNATDGSVDSWNTNSQLKITSGNNALAFSVIGTFNQRLGIIQSGHNGDGVSSNPSLGDEKLALQPYNGKVGIGTTSPSKKLHIKGGNDNVLFLDNAGEQYTTQYLANNGATKGIFGWDNTNTLLTIGTAVAGDFNFLINNSEKARITNGGNVLIGTTTDDGVNKLQVNGGGYFTQGIKVGAISNTPFTNSSWIQAQDDFTGVFLTNNSVDKCAGLKADGTFYISGNAIINGLAGTGTRTVVADASGNLSAVASAGTVSSGTYSPTITNLANATSLTVFNATYIRVDNIVTVSVSFQFAAVSANTQSSCFITLPINTSVTTGYRVGTGTSATSTDQETLIAVIGNTDKVAITKYALNTFSHDCNIIFQYRIS